MQLCVLCMLFLFANYSVESLAALGAAASASLNTPAYLVLLAANGSLGLCSQDVRDGGGVVLLSNTHGSLPVVSVGVPAQATAPSM
jgi:hypothetical protein